MESESRSQDKQPEVVEPTAPASVERIDLILASRVSYLSGYRDGMTDFVMLILSAVVALFLIRRFYGPES